MATVKAWLVVNYNGDMRLRQTRPTLSLNECAFLLNVTIPERRRAPVTEIDITLPEQTEPSWEMSVGDVQI